MNLWDCGGHRVLALRDSAKPGRACLKREKRERKTRSYLLRRASLK